MSTYTVTKLPRRVRQQCDRTGTRGTWDITPGFLGHWLLERILCVYIHRLCVMDNLVNFLRCILCVLKCVTYIVSENDCSHFSGSPKYDRYAPRIRRNAPLCGRTPSLTTLTACCITNLCFNEKQHNNTRNKNNICGYTNNTLI